MNVNENISGVPTVTGNAVSVNTKFADGAYVIIPFIALYDNVSDAPDPPA